MPFLRHIRVLSCEFSGYLLSISNLTSTRPTTAFPTSSLPTITAKCDWRFRSPYEILTSPSCSSDTAPTSSPAPAPQPKSNGGAIAGGIIGAIIFVILLYLFTTRKRPNSHSDAAIDSLTVESELKTYSESTTGESVPTYFSTPLPLYPGAFSVIPCCACLLTQPQIWKASPHMRVILLLISSRTCNRVVMSPLHRLLVSTLRILQSLIAFSNYCAEATLPPLPPKRVASAYHSPEQSISEPWNPGPDLISAVDVVLQRHTSMISMNAPSDAAALDASPPMGQ